MPESEEFYNSITNEDTLPNFNTFSNNIDVVLRSEFTGPGSAYQVVKQYNKNMGDESGRLPIIIKPDETEKKNKNRIN